MATTWRESRQAGQDARRPELRAGSPDLREEGRPPARGPGPGAPRARAPAFAFAKTPITPFTFSLFPCFIGSDLAGKARPPLFPALIFRPSRTSPLGREGRGRVAGTKSRGAPGRTRKARQRSMGQAPARPLQTAGPLYDLGLAAHATGRTGPTYPRRRGSAQAGPGRPGAELGRVSDNRLLCNPSFRLRFT